MKKFAIAIAALSLSAGAAFAENPYVSRTDVIQSGPYAGQPIDRRTSASIFDYGTTGSISGDGRAFSRNHSVADHIAPTNQRVLSGR
ncbi:MAG: hypothetical protein QHC90_11895 [Shinella sp.]|nr:hypothetical protein [Shinella sp.]